MSYQIEKILFNILTILIISSYFVLTSSALAVRHNLINSIEGFFQSQRTTIIKRYISSNGGKMNDLIVPDVAKMLVKEQFPQWAHHAIIPVSTSGWDNRTFHFGNKMLLRFPSAEGYASQVEKEQRWLPHLASQLPIEIPTPLGFGKPGHGYKWNWSVYRWINGETAVSSSQLDKIRFARQLANFLTSLYEIDIEGGPKSAEHSYYRGGKVSIYGEETVKALEILNSQLDTKIFRKIWDSGAETEWQKPPVWVHGDVSPGNLIVKNGNLKAVIDFGLLSVGDPACDLTISWTFFDSQSRINFRKHLSLDDETWRRGRAWALWKALIISAKLSNSNAVENALAGKVIKEILDDFQRNG